MVWASWWSPLQVWRQHGIHCTVSCCHTAVQNVLHGCFVQLLFVVPCIWYRRTAFLLCCIAVKLGVWVRVMRNASMLRGTMLFRKSSMRIGTKVSNHCSIIVLAFLYPSCYPRRNRGVYPPRGHGASPPRWPNGSPIFWL